MSSEPKVIVKNDDAAKELVILGYSSLIVILSTVAGWIWAGIINPLPSAPYAGAFGGLLVGIILVLTARLAARR